MWQKLIDVLIGAFKAVLYATVGGAVRLFILSSVVLLFVVMYDWLTPFLDFVWSFLPPHVSEDWSPFKDAFKIANAYLPLQETVLAFVAFWGWTVVYAAVRFIKKCIPTEA